jgi:urease accessory protein
MIKVTRFSEETTEASELLIELEYDTRKRSRINASAKSGEEVGIILPRGSVLNDKDKLRSDCGKLVEIIAAEEQLSSLKSEDNFALMRAAYHLGNRHMPVQIMQLEGLTCIRYPKDYVLDDMVKGFGLDVKYVLAPFQPENGAYGKLGDYHRH